MPMHTDQLEVDAATVRALVAAQFPQWSSQPLRPVPSDGTVNQLWRLGSDLVLRFPLVATDVDEQRRALASEAHSARRLLGRVTVATPEPVAFGEPGEAFAMPWAVYRWLPGTVATSKEPAGAEGDVGGSDEFAGDLARFVASVREIDVEGAVFEGPGRGGLLSSVDDYVHRSLAVSHGLTDVPALTALWNRLHATPREGADVLTHGDLMPGNLLVAQGRLAAVIDVGGSGPADPALDLQPAWNLLRPGPRESFRRGLGVDDDEWARGQGWALAQAIGCLHYYRETNPVMSRIAAQTLTNLLAAA